MLLGRRLSVEATVIYGKQLGGKIGFPTVNFAAEKGRILPKNGVYASYVYYSTKRYLGMTNVRFKVEIATLKSFSPSGLDDISFMFSANKNQPLKPAGEVASGGEISRLMLSIKSLIAAAKTLPTIIFDEIDTGVSGDIADRMGEVMKSMSDHLQVITITHLPQVAGKGNAHFKVFKQDDENETTTHIVQLNDDQRINEIARMLSGSTITQEAISNAKTLLSNK